MFDSTAAATRRMTPSGWSTSGQFVSTSVRIVVYCKLI